MRNLSKYYLHEIDQTMGIENSGKKIRLCETAPRFAGLEKWSNKVNAMWQSVHLGKLNWRISKVTING